MLTCHRFPLSYETLKVSGLEYRINLRSQLRPSQIDYEYNTNSGDNIKMSWNTMIITAVCVIFLIKPGVCSTKEDRCQLLTTPQNVSHHLVFVRGDVIYSKNILLAARVATFCTRQLSIIDIQYNMYRCRYLILKLCT